MKKEGALHLNFGLGIWSSKGHGGILNKFHQYEVIFCLVI
jgi:hypothetical protein